MPPRFPTFASAPQAFWAAVLVALGWIVQFATEVARIPEQPAAAAQGIAVHALRAVTASGAEVAHLWWSARF
jgi:hypothetical protein